MSENSFSHNCEHEQEIIFLQQKLSETHQKLMQQIQITKQKELEIIALKKGNKHQPSFNRQQTDNSVYHSENTEETLSQKIWLLQQNLQGMRKKVMEEIKQKKELKKKMAEQTAKYQVDLKQEKQKFEGLEIIYLKLLQTSQHKQNRPTTQTIAEMDYKDQEKSTGYIKSLKNMDKRATNDKNAKKGDSLSKENKQKGTGQVGRHNVDEGQQRGNVLKQIQEVKNSYRKQNQLATSNSNKLKIDHQKFRQRNRNNNLTLQN